MKIVEGWKRTWDFLTANGLTEEGAAGLMGNLFAESSIIFPRLEVLCRKRLREAGKGEWSDEAYTRAVDDGTISKEEFLHPLPGKQYGYGVAQWTTPARKSGLYALAKEMKQSIGSETVQLTFLLSELKTSFKTVYKALTTSHDLGACSDLVLTKFEAPANAMSHSAERYMYSKTIYNEYHGKGKTMVTAQDVISVFQGWLGKDRAKGTHKDIIDLYNSHKPLARGYKVTYSDEYCDTTVSAAFIKLGATDLIGGTECGVQEHVKKFQAAGIWIEDGTITPKPGDIIVFSWSKATQPNDNYANHIGIVEKVSGSKITTIEGNYNGKVARRNIAVGHGNIRGFARPKYAAKVSPDPKKETKPAGSGKSSGTALNRTPKRTGKVTAGALNVRKWAGTENGLCSFSPVYMNETVEICDTVKAANGVEWYYIRYNGKYGFVSSKYIK